MAAIAQPLLDERGCGALTAAKLIGEIAGIQRFASDAKLARLAGLAPIPASSGRTTRHRLDRGGNRQLNCALHRFAVTNGRLDPDTAAYLARKQAEGKSRREALRCLKRHLARRVWRLLQPPADVGAAALSPPPTQPRPTITIHCNPLQALLLDTEETQCSSSTAALSQPPDRPRSAHPPAPDENSPARWPRSTRLRHAT